MLSFIPSTACCSYFRHRCIQMILLVAGSPFSKIFNLLVQSTSFLIFVWPVVSSFALVTRLKSQECCADWQLVWFPSDQQGRMGSFLSNPSRILFGVLVASDSRQCCSNVLSMLFVSSFPPAEILQQCLDEGGSSANVSNIQNCLVCFVWCTECPLGALCADKSLFHFRQFAHNTLAVMRSKVSSDVDHTSGTPPPNWRGKVDYTCHDRFLCFVSDNSEHC